MCMDNQANVGKDSMYSGKLGGNIGRGAANFTPTSQDIPKASAATYTDSKGNKQYIDDQMPKEIELTPTKDPNVFIASDGEVVVKEKIDVPKLKKAKMEPSSYEGYKLLYPNIMKVGGM